MRIAYAIVFVSDMHRSILFYRDVVGLPVRFASPGWTEFGTDGATLAFHVTKDANPDAGHSGLEPAGRCRPGLHVPDLDGFHQRMVDHGVPCLQMPTEQFGVRLALYCDPDGLPFSVAQERKT